MKIVMPIILAVTCWYSFRFLYYLILTPDFSAYYKVPVIIITLALVALIAKGIYRIMKDS